MILTTLKLKNFRVHQDLELKFVKGVNGVVGRNGKGKSTIIEAIQFLFTGKLDSTKEEVITLGKTNGYVIGEFEHDGKVGKLQRWLGESKVHLEYDNKQYVKASEVRDLWNQLFQIDTTIFSNVIIAHQGEIPLLFSGEQSEREKIFQKIFMVPNTTKLRSIIWDDYIKTAPPEFPVETDDVLAALAKSIVEKEAQIKKFNEDITNTQKVLLTVEQIDALNARKYFCNKCIHDATSRKSFEQMITEFQGNLTDSRKDEEGLVNELKQIDIAQYEKAEANMSSLQKIYNLRLTLTAQLAELTPQLCSKEEQAKITDRLAVLLDKELRPLREEKIKFMTHANEAKAFIDNLAGVKGHTSCPTCGQEVKQLNFLLNTQKTKYDEAVVKIKELENTIRITEVEAKALSDHTILTDQLQRRIDVIKTQLATLGEVNFSQDDYNLVVQVIKSYKTQEEALRTIRNLIISQDNNIKLYQTKLEGCAVYDKDTTPESELIEITASLGQDDACKTLIRDLSAKITILNSEIATAKDKIANAVVTKEKNAKRQAYLKTLQELYDLFHTSQFPRKLISSYSNEVEVELRKNLSRFTIPYTACVDENFKINLITHDDLVLPKISGGQEMIVGLCLRIALHTMFSQAFPLLILDEGTTHLDEEENKPLYFDMVKNLKNETGIAQVILIDHDRGLLGVVDNVIQL